MVNGVVIDTAAIVAGLQVAGGAAAVADRLVETKKSSFAVCKKWIAPKRKETVFVVKGGMEEDMILDQVNRRKDKETVKKSVTLIKGPIP